MKTSALPSASTSPPPPARQWPWLALVLAFGGVLLPLGLFGALAEDVWEKQTFRFDDPTLLFLHAHASPRWDSIMLLASLLGGLRGMLPLIFAVALALWFSKERAQTRFVAFSVGGACFLNVAAKMLFRRVRPDLWRSIALETDYSFPSGHAMLSMAVVATLLFLIWNWRLPRALQWSATIVGIAFVAWVGLSRLYLGVHFPSDIIAGWCASLAWVSATYFALKWKFRTRHALAPAD